MRQTDTTTMLQALAAFGPQLRAPGASAGQWADQTGSGTVDDPLTMPYFKSNDLLDRFINMTYEVGWIKNFDWMEWSRGVEAKMLFRDKALLAQATTEQMANVLTTVVRSDRFSEGAMAGYFKDGILPALAERVEALLAAKARSVSTNQISAEGSYRTAITHVIAPHDHCARADARGMRCRLERLVLAISPPVGHDVLKHV
jgi:hypothetical protein